MAEDANRDDRRNVQNDDSGQDTPFTLSQLEKTEKPADFTMSDLSAAQASSQDGARSAAAGPRTAAGQAQPDRAEGTSSAARSAGTARLLGRDIRSSAADGRPGAGSSLPGAAHPARTSSARTSSGRDSRSGQSAAHPAQPARASRVQPAQGPRIGQKRRVPRARRMKLSVTKISPWSVAKVTFMLSIAMGIIQTVCVAILYGIIDAAGVFDKITSLVSQTGLASNFNMSSILSLGQILSAVIIFSVFEVVIMVLLSVILTFLYNVASSLVGGIHVTLGDD